MQRDLVQLYERECEEIAARLPKVLRNVAGYNLHRLGGPSPNLARLLVGSEGTLAVFTDLTLQLQPIPAHRAVGVCHFPTLHAAMEATQHIVTLEPSSVELTDRAMLSLARERPEFTDRVARFVRGDPGALLFVEFSGDTADDVLRGLEQLTQLMRDLGHQDAVVPARGRALQREIWAVRKAALNIVMSMRDDRKPVSFIEDCAVPLEHLAAYTDAIEEIFARHRTTGTFYAHASVGCLHIRPALNLKDPHDVRTMRTIAEEAHQLVRRFGGSHSGEHGDGLVRSEFLTPMLGTRLVDAFGEVKQIFDPTGILNPGKIVDPPRMDDRSLMRYGPEYRALPIAPALDWTSWGGWLGAAEMCNNNGACRRREPGAMCPSFRATHDERDVTRGRANSLRLALSGQLGPEALTSHAMYETMDLCVGCKACRRECPTGVDMARMKIEFLHQYHRKHARSLADLAIAHLPRYAPWASRLPALFNLRNRHAPLARVSERWLGLSARRRLPSWRRDIARDRTTSGEAEAVLFVDTFNRYFEPENVRAALAVLDAAGIPVAIATSGAGTRPLCCGRTYLNAGMMDEARAEAQRVLAALAPSRAGTPIIGLEPSCIMTLRDEFPALLPGPVSADVAQRSMLFEDFLVRRHDRLAGVFEDVSQRIVIHPHCHQRAFGAADLTAQALGTMPSVETVTLDAGCCGMAGAFGYEARHYDVSMRIGELDLFPALRAEPDQTVIVAGGTSCRHQIRDGTGREALHPARALEAMLRQKTVRT
jgi:Fe-S oxidoreductase